MVGEWREDGREDAVRPSVCRPSAVRRPQTRFVGYTEYQHVETVESKVVDNGEGHRR